MKLPDLEPNYGQSESQSDSEASSSWNASQPSSATSLKPIFGSFNGAGDIQRINASTVAHSKASASGVPATVATPDTTMSTMVSTTSSSSADLFASPFPEVMSPTLDPQASRIPRGGDEVFGPLTRSAIYLTLVFALTFLVFRRSSPSTDRTRRLSDKSEG